jgi:hypothetical protein
LETTHLFSWTVVVIILTLALELAAQVLFRQLQKNTDKQQKNREDGIW